MKGCLAVVGVLLVLGIVVLVGGGFWVGKKFMEAGAAIQASFTVLEKTDADFPFTRPTDSRLNSERLDSVLAIRSKLVEAARPNLTKFEQIENEESNDILGAFKESIAVMTQVPLDLEKELRLAQMSISEFLWTLDTVFGTVFAAADRGEARAVELAAKIETTFKPQDSANPELAKQFSEFRNRAKASLVAFDEASFELALARQDQLAPDFAYALFDRFVEDRGREFGFAKPK